jgi:tRNA pseudouridine32 synthase/23S rRNA pseudouridine746 synthase
MVRKTRLEAGAPFFLMREVAGTANTETEIQVLEAEGPRWRYALSPVTGKKHQLRVHMAALGAGIINDRFYPTLRQQDEDDPAQPLQLLAQQLAFADPLTGAAMQFDSQQTLQA